MKYIIISTATKNGYAATAIKVIDNNVLAYVVANTKEHPTRAVAKSEILNTMKDHERLPASGTWRVE